MANERRKIWNYRCELCFCENPVFVDNGLCFACDPATQEEAAKRDKELGFDGV